MSTSTKWFLGILAVLVVLAIGFTFLLVSIMSTSSDRIETVTSGSGGKIAVVDVKGVIMASDEVVRQIKKYRENSSIRAILLHIDTPGGAVVPSQEMYEEVKNTRDGGKPVVVSMGSLATSGGYYVACGSSRIVANRATLTGNVGVLSEFLQVYELMGKIGVDVKTLRSGRLKDAGSPTRKMTEEDQKYFQDLINDVLAQFMDDVTRERKLTAKQRSTIADGRAVTGRQALALNLVDTLGTFEDALKITASLAGIEGDPSVVKERKRVSWLEGMLSDAAESAFLGARNILETPVLSYRFAAP